MSNRQPRLTFRTAAALALAFGLVTVAACTSPQTPTPGASASFPASVTPTKQLVVAATAEPKTMDPTFDAAAAGSQLMLYNVYETLVKTDSEGDLRPLLAQRWEVSPDRLTYTFYLNPAAKFASGAAVTAEAAAKNLERVRTGQVDGTAVTIAAKLKTAMSVMTGTKAVDATTLQVTLSRPSNTLLYELSSTAGMIMDPAAFGSLATATGGSGPYRLKQWNRGDSIVLERNPGYWGTQGRFEQVSFKYFADPNAENAALLSGDVDIISNVQAPDALSQFSDTSKYRVTEGVTNGEVVLGLNNANAALKDVRVRRAIAMAIDKQRLVDDVWAGHGTVIGTMDVPTDPYYEDLSSVNAYNVAAAKQLLAEAGYASGLTLRLKPPALPYATASAQSIAASLKAIGVTVTIEELQFPARWLDVVYDKADYDMTVIAHVEARDLVNYTNPNYYWKYNNAQFNALWLAADEAAPGDYAAEMKKAARFLADDAASVWLFDLPNLVVSKATVTGIAKNATSLSFDVTTIATR